MMDARLSQCVSVGMREGEDLHQIIGLIHLRVALALHLLFLPLYLDEENIDQKHRKHRPTLLYIGCKEEIYLDG